MGQTNTGIFSQFPRELSVSTNVGLLFVHRLGRWPNIGTTLGGCLMITGGLWCHQGRMRNAHVELLSGGGDNAQMGTVKVKASPWSRRSK